jgi:hypothetical protein
LWENSTTDLNLIGDCPISINRRRSIHLGRSAIVASVTCTS